MLWQEALTHRPEVVHSGMAGSWIKTENEKKNKNGKKPIPTSYLDARMLPLHGLEELVDEQQGCAMHHVRVPVPQGKFRKEYLRASLKAGFQRFNSVRMTLIA
jgi:hypothetical protein